LAYYIKSLNPFEQYKFKKANDKNMIKLLEGYLDGNVGAALKAATTSNKSGGNKRRKTRKNRRLRGGAYIRELQSCSGNPITDLVEFVLSQYIGIFIKILQKEGVSLIGAIGQIIDELNEVIPGHFDASKYLGLTNQHGDLKVLHSLMKQLHPAGVSVEEPAPPSGNKGEGASHGTGMPSMNPEALQGLVAQASGLNPGAHQKDGKTPDGKTPDGKTPDGKKSAATPTTPAGETGAKNKSKKHGMIQKTRGNISTGFKNTTGKISRG
jgi:hypothetical protein